jgi:hypothetical protein
LRHLCECGADVVSAILQDWNSEFFLDEVHLPTDRPVNALSSTDPIVVAKYRLNVQADEAKELMKRLKKIKESHGVHDLRVYQSTGQDYVHVFSFPVKTMEQYHQYTGEALEFYKTNAKEIQLTTCSVFGDMPAAVYNAAIADFHPEIVASEVKF